MAATAQRRRGQGKAVECKEVWSSNRAEAMLVPGLPEPVSHYSDVVASATSPSSRGIVAMGEDGAVVGVGDPITQARKIFEKLHRVLDALGARPRTSSR